MLNQNRADTRLKELNPLGFCLGQDTRVRSDQRQKSGKQWKQSESSAKSWFHFSNLRKDVMDDSPMDVGQSKIAAAVTISEAFMVETHQYRIVACRS